MNKKWIFFSILFLAVIAIITVTFIGNGSEQVRSPENSDTIRIGSKNFTEQLILGEIIAQLIEKKTELSVKRVLNLGGTMICHRALLNNEIDLYPEYTGTALRAVLNLSSDSASSKETWTTVKTEYRNRFRLKWMEPFGFNNTYAVTVRKKDAELNQWDRISQLWSTAGNLQAGFTSEFQERPDGYPGLKTAYGFGFGSTRDLDSGLMYQALANGEVDVICGFSTDGRILALGLKILEDDKKFFPPYQAAPVIRQATIQEHPELIEVLGMLFGTIDDTAMQRLNYEVDGNGRSTEDVARGFLISNGLITN